MTLQLRWSALHHGIDPAKVPLLLAWLRLMWWIARPIRVVPPTAITALGVLLAWGAVPLADGLPAAAAALVVLAALCDGLDGAVAVVADRASALGARADAVADRLADVAFAAVLWRTGAPWALALGCAVLAVGVDVLRRVRRRPAVVTVGERPTWTICAALAACCAAVSSAHWPVLVCAAVWPAAGLVALGQIALAQTARPFQLSRPLRRSRHEDAVR
jgi:CDP-diacylglycerol--glycerol-3-phosphate 3-phosphatidyltransferase